MIRNQSGQTAQGQVLNVATGAAFAGVVTVYVTIDGGTQAIGSVGSGLCAAEGNGLYTYIPSIGETNGASIAFTFTGPGAIPATTIYDTQTVAQVTASLAASTPASVTVNALLTAALSRLLADADGANPDHLALALLRLNDLIDAWKIEGLTVYTISRVLWTITGATSYTVGSAGTIVVDRPSNASDLRFALLNNAFTVPVEMPIDNFTEDQYQAIAIKSLTSTYPQGFYYNPTSPFGTLTPWPVPTSSSLQGVMYANAPAGEVGLYDTLSLPQGYRRFYRDNLAVELAPDFDLQPSQVLVQSAIDSKASVKRANVRMVELVSDAAGLGGDAGVWTVGRFYGGP